MSEYMKDEWAVQNAILLITLNHRLDQSSCHHPYRNETPDLKKDEILLHINPASRIIAGYKDGEELENLRANFIALGSEDDGCTLFDNERATAQSILQILAKEKIIDMPQARKCTFCVGGTGISFKVLDWSKIYNLATERTYDGKADDPYSTPNQDEIVEKAVGDRYVEYGTEKLKFSYDNLPSKLRRHVQLFSTLVRMENEGLISIVRNFPERLQAITDFAADANVIVLIKNPAALLKKVKRASGQSSGQNIGRDEAPPSMFLRKDDYGKYFYNNIRIDITTNTIYYNVFDILFTYHDPAGFLSYGDIEKELVKLGYPPAKDRTARNKRVQNAISNKQEGFFKYAKTNGRELKNKTLKGEKLISLVRGGGLKLNNPPIPN